MAGAGATWRATERTSWRNIDLSEESGKANGGRRVSGKGRSGKSQSLPRKGVRE